MAKFSAILSYMQHRTTLSTETFLIPIPINDQNVAQSLPILANQILSACSGKSPSFQRRNYRSLIQKIQILLPLLESLTESGIKHNPSLVTCLTELYVLLNRARDLLIYCLESSRLRLLMSNPMTSIYFHDLDREVLCILDVITQQDLHLHENVADILELMRTQLGKGKVFIDPVEQSLKSTLFSFYEGLDEGEVPDFASLYKYFVEGLGIRDTETWREEIKSLDDMILRRTRDIDVPSSVLRGFVALMKYSKLFIFGFHENLMIDEANNVTEIRGSQVHSETSVMPEEFLCPISHDLMLDPVTLTTGQTFDRAAILNWFNRGNLICPVTRTELDGILIVPNKALQSVISKWCTAQGIPYDPTPSPEAQLERRRNFETEFFSRAVLEAKKATVELMLHIFSRGTESDRNLAVAQLRLLTDYDKIICIHMVKSGWVPFLLDLLKSEDQAAQENSAVTIKHLSVYIENKISIIEVRGSIKSILEVIQSAQTDTTRVHALSTIRDLSMFPGCQRAISKEKKLVEVLSAILTSGSLFDQLTVMETLYDLSMPEENRNLLIKGGLVKAMVKVITLRPFIGWAADILARLVTSPLGARWIRKETNLVITLTRILQWGAPSERAYAANTLLAFFMHGGSRAMRLSSLRPQLRDLIPSLLQSDLFEDTFKAAQLLRLHESAYADHIRNRAGGSSISNEDVATHSNEDVATHNNDVATHNNEDVATHNNDVAAHNNEDVATHSNENVSTPPN